MPKIHYPYQQHRQATGNYTRMQDIDQPQQKAQLRLIQKLAQQQGLHLSNTSRREISQAIVGLLSVLNSVRNTHLQPAITTTRGKGLALENRLRYADELYNNARQNKLSPVKYNTLNSIPVLDNTPAAKFIDSPTVWETVIDSLHRATEHAFTYDIFRFPAASASDLPPYQPPDEEKSDEIDSLFDIPDDFIRAGQEKISRLYTEKNSVYDRLTESISLYIKENVFSKTKLTIKPEDTYLLCFNRVEDSTNSAEIRMIPPAQENNTLVNWLLTELSWPQSRLDTHCGIYDKKNIQDYDFGEIDRLPLSPSEFVKIFGGFNIYSFAHEHLIEPYDNKNLIIKKKFVEFATALDNSKLGNDFVGDVLQGIGKLEGREVTVALFDINGYKASNAFMFKNHKVGRVTLYFDNDIKFKNFINNKSMRDWVIKNCNSEEGRQKIASHFSFSLRQDGFFYSGIDSWLKTLGQDASYNMVIASSPVPMDRKFFFDIFFNNIKSKTISDLSFILKSQSETRINLWEKIMYELCVIPNPVTPFIAFSLNIAHLINAEGYEEKIDEYKKLQLNIINIFSMNLLSELVSSEAIEGYEFIKRVKVIIQEFENISKETAIKPTSIKKNQNDASYLLSSNTIDPLNFHRVTLPRGNNYNTYAIEDKAYQYLTINGKIAESQSYLNVHQGVFIDGNFQLLFSTGDNQFSISECNEDGIIEIVNNKDSEYPVTKLYQYQDSYLLVRKPMNEDPIPTVILSECRKKKAPGLPSGCTSLKMTVSLDELLKDKVKKGYASKKNILSRDMVPTYADDYPNTYINTKSSKIYFLHNGYFFNAQWIPPGSKVNPLKSYILRLYRSETLFRKDEEIVLLVSQKKGNVVTFGTVEEYLSRKINIPAPMLEDYFQDLGTTSIFDSSDLHGAIDSIRSAGIYSIPNLKIHETIQITLTQGLIRKSLYPMRFTTNNTPISLIHISNIDKNSPAYLYFAKEKVQKCIMHIKKDILPNILSMLAFSNQKSQKYISDIFNIKDEIFIKHFSLELHSRLDFILDHLYIDNIYFSSIEKRPAKTYNKILPGEHLIINTILTYEDCKYGALAFTTTDGTGRIVINEDKLHYMNAGYEKFNAVKDEEIIQNLVDVMIHEASHLSGMTTDITYLPVKKGKFLPVSDSIKSMIDNIRRGKISSPYDFEKINNDYFNSIAVYRSIKNKIESNQALSYILERDPGYLATIILNNADCIAILCRDLYTLYRKK